MIFDCFKKKKKGTIPPKTTDLIIIPEVKSDWSDFEMDVAELIMYERQWEAGLNELFLDPYLCTIAQIHSKYMVKQMKPSHDNFPDRVIQAQQYADAKWVGEIVAFGHGTARGVVRGWMSSEGHKKIILKEQATHYGISIEHGIKNGELRNYFTVVFSERKQ